MNFKVSVVRTSTDLQTALNQLDGEGYSVNHIFQDANRYILVGERRSTQQYAAGLPAIEVTRKENDEKRKPGRPKKED